MTDPHDPKGLVREAYAIDGITAGECRSIFLDWALSLPDGADPLPAVRALLARHDVPHPMTDTLQAALRPSGRTGRRGGKGGRAPP